MGPPPNGTDDRERSAAQQFATQSSGVSEQAWRPLEKAGAVLEKQAEQQKVAAQRRGLGNGQSSLELLQEEEAEAERKGRGSQAREPKQEAARSLPPSYEALSELFKRVQMAMFMLRHRPVSASDLP